MRRGGFQPLLLFTSQNSRTVVHLRGRHRQQDSVKQYLHCLMGKRWCHSLFFSLAYSRIFYGLLDSASFFKNFIGDSSVSPNYNTMYYLLIMKNPYPSYLWKLPLSLSPASPSKFVRYILFSLSSSSIFSYFPLCWFSVFHLIDVLQLAYISVPGPIIKYSDNLWASFLNCHQLENGMLEIFRIGKFDRLGYFWEERYYQYITDCMLNVSSSLPGISSAMSNLLFNHSFIFRFQLYILARCW